VKLTDHNVIILIEEKKKKVAGDIVISKYHQCHPTLQVGLYSRSSKQQKRVGWECNLNHYESEQKQQQTAVATRK